MSRALKIKLFISGLSLLILILIPLIKNNFNAPVSMIRWRNLTWNDFQGFTKPFSGWGAVINSNLYLEFDSVRGQFACYAAMNNQQSWTKKSSMRSDYLLRHEQYHFNISEYFARLLNQWIEKEKPKTESEIQDKLLTFRGRLKSWQEQYDDDSDHSIKRSEQRRWEFEIDSLLSGFEADSGYVTDYYSGGQVFLPTTTSFDKGTREDGAVYRSYFAYQYGMYFSLVTRQYREVPSDLTSYLLNDYKSDSLLVKSFQVDSTEFLYNAVAHVHDTAEQEVIIYRWIYNGDYLYKVMVTRNMMKDSAAYERIANTFVNSFKIADTRNYWETSSESSSDSVYIQNVEIIERPKHVDDSESCLAQVYGAQYGFYGKPIVYDDGSILIPYSNTQHADSLIQELLVVHNDKQFSCALTEPSYIFLHGSDVPARHPFYINVGYTTKQKAANGCTIYFSQRIWIDTKTRRTH